MKMKTKKLTLAGLLAAAALILFVVEAQFPSLTAIPGIKLGLSNAVTVFCLYSLGPLFTLAVLLIRILLGSFVTGQISALLYSLAGGLLAFGMATLLSRLLPAKQLWVVSILSAMVHNLAQLAVAILITATPTLLIYLPLLLLSAIFAGAITGLAAQFVFFRLRKAAFITTYVEK